ncbi:tetratricopeptide repeat protein, partial [Ancylomarina sp.]|uniref:tetratricopeptide repeat protein n=1 Tax=Ancylomarina sp. TaxID=1970196 RepID=UPI003566FEEC
HLQSYLLTLTIIPLLFMMIAWTVKDEGKIPITTSSDEALNHYLQGLALSDKYLNEESIPYYEKAIAADPDFAMAYLNLSFVQASTKEFYEYFNIAVALVDHVSEGERLQIIGWNALYNDAKPLKQREYFQKLVEAYPNDERSHYLLGLSYNGQQEWEPAIEAFKKATKIAPDFSPPYNIMGYAYMFLENYSEAEKAFKKYAELIPDDPNPQDSYAELLMKMGKYDKSIEHYNKALDLDPNFIISYAGIASNLNYKKKHVEARKQLQKYYDMAHNDGERSNACFAMAVSYVDEGHLDQALMELKNKYDLDEKIEDAGAMSRDLMNMGDVLLEMGNYDKAMAKFDKAVQVIEESNLKNEVKENFKRFYLYNAGYVASMKKDFVTAKAKSEEFRKQAEAMKNLNLIRFSHQLAGIIALEEKDYDKATEELQQANQQNPYNLYRMALAYKYKGDNEKAKKLCTKAAKFNALSNLNYAFIRNKAENLLAGM